MNKKLKIFVALTVIIQLLVPSSLLICQYSVLDTAKNLETEYKFNLSGLKLNYKLNSENSPDTTESPIFFSIANFNYQSRGKYTVFASPNNKVLSVKKLQDGDDTDYWFYGKSFMVSCTIEPENYSYAPDIDVNALKEQLRREFNISDASQREPLYLTAKIYKGIFIPTAIYFKGEKIIDIKL